MWRVQMVRRLGLKILVVSSDPEAISGRVQVRKYEHITSTYRMTTRQ